MSKFSLAGKTAVITGGAGGLGRAMVAAYAEAGANVVVASRGQEKIDATAADIRDKGQNAIAIPVDITDAEQVDNLEAKTVEEFGSLDIIVNNADYIWNSTISINSIIFRRVISCMFNCITYGLFEVQIVSL